MPPEISGDLLDRHPVFAVASDPHDVVAELLGIGPCHGDILPARPPWASDLRCHLSVQQTHAALQERFDGWSHSKTRITYGDQSAQLSDIRVVRPDHAVWSFSSQRAALRRLHKAFAGFFRRVKAGKTPGYPRFKGTARFDSVEW